MTDKFRLEIHQTDECDIMDIDDINNVIEQFMDIIYDKMTDNIHESIETWDKTRDDYINVFQTSFCEDVKRLESEQIDQKETLEKLEELESNITSSISKSFKELYDILDDKIRTDRLIDAIDDDITSLS